MLLQLRTTAWLGLRRVESGQSVNYVDHESVSLAFRKRTGKVLPLVWIVIHSISLEGTKARVLSLRVYSI